MTIDIKKLVRRTLQLAIGTGTLLFFSFVIFGWANGLAVGSALIHIFERFPVVETNPVIADLRGHRVSWRGNIENRALAESSGLAASTLQNDVLWSMNDSGSAAEIFAFTVTGADLGRWAIDMPDPVDWEAMDSFQLDGVSYLLIADVGDNFRWRPTLSFVVVEEPDLTSRESVIPVAWQVSYQYPDGFRDCEAVAVDPDTREVLLVSKRRYPSEVYVLPLQSDTPVTARKIAELSHLPRPTELDMEEDPDGGKYRHMPSGMDLLEHQLLITTNMHAYLYDRDDLSQAPLRVRLPSIGQGEAIAYSHHLPGVAFVTKERRQTIGISDVFMIELPAAVQTTAGDALNEQ